ncbi:MAG: tellurite resistance TerB family protein [Paracoccaceae bacterium]|jgi:tellurite resistance protein|nr:tellurite resistance TerB family protein [Alphaproteobacteria bacterium]MDG1211943.1 tellurite resistance TerB family protein [Paracoccaceae bacterium]MDG1370932.1 tellurite resistance TerB family protein [Paracoccaceae bacterium]
MTAVLSPQDALIAVMVGTSVVDAKQSDAELLTIEAEINSLPAFADYDHSRIPGINSLVKDLFDEDDGIDALIGLVQEALPERFNETAYALACDIAAADGKVNMSELRFLEIVRHDLKVGRLASAAIERGARARHQRF